MSPFVPAEPDKTWAKDVIVARCWVRPGGTMLFVGTQVGIYTELTAADEIREGVQVDVTPPDGGELLELVATKNEQGFHIARFVPEVPGLYGFRMSLVGGRPVVVRSDFYVQS